MNIYDTDHIIPRSHDGLHVKITGEESDDSVRDDLAILDKNTPEVSYYSWVIPDFESRANSHLVTPPRYDQWKECIAGERHRVGLLDDGGEL